MLSCHKVPSCQLGCLKWTQDDWDTLSSVSLSQNVIFTPASQILSPLCSHAVFYFILTQDLKMIKKKHNNIQIITGSKTFQSVSEGTNDVACDRQHPPREYNFLFPVANVNPPGMPCLWGCLEGKTDWQRTRFLYQACQNQQPTEEDSSWWVKCLLVAGAKVERTSWLWITGEGLVATSSTQYTYQQNGHDTTDW